MYTSPLCLPLMANLFSLQDGSDLELQVQNFACNYPYIVPVKSSEQVQFFIAAEGVLFGETQTLFGTLINLISVYFTFNIQYPKPLYSLFIFIQHIILMKKDTQHTPSVVTQLVSVLDKICYYSYSYSIILIIIIITTTTYMI